MKKKLLLTGLFVIIAVLGGATFLYSQKTINEDYWVVYKTSQGNLEQWNPGTNQREIIPLEKGQDVLKESVRKEIEHVPTYGEGKKEGELEYQLSPDGSVWYYKWGKCKGSEKLCLEDSGGEYKIPGLSTGHYEFLAWDKDKTEMYFRAWPNLDGEVIVGGSLYGFNVNTKILRTIVRFDDIYSIVANDGISDCELTISPLGERAWLTCSHNIPVRINVPGTTNGWKIFEINIETGAITLPEYIPQGPGAFIISPHRLTPSDYTAESSSQISQRTEHQANKPGVSNLVRLLPFENGLQIKVTRDINHRKEEQIWGSPNGYSAYEYAHNPANNIVGMNADTYENDKLFGLTPCVIECNACLSNPNETSPYTYGTTGAACSDCNVIPMCHDNRHEKDATDFNTIVANDSVRIIASSSGIVIQKSYVGGGGNTISIQSADGSVQSYCHLASYAISIVDGIRVVQGTFLGIMGKSGTSSIHLHTAIVPYNDFSDDGTKMVNGRTPAVYESCLEQDLNPQPFIPRQNVRYTSTNTINTVIPVFPKINPAVAIALACGVETPGTTEHGKYDIVKYGDNMCTGPEMLYKVVVAGGQNCTVEFTDGTSLPVDLDCFVYGDIITTINPIEKLISASKLKEIISFSNPFTSPRTYYIVVDGKHRRYGNYTIKATGCSAIANCPDSYEPNNSFLTARNSRQWKSLSLLSNSKKEDGSIRNRKSELLIHGCIGDVTDEDYFTWSCVGKGKLTIIMNAYVGTKRVELYNGFTWNEVGELNSNVADSQITFCKSGTDGNICWLRITGDPGSYTLKANWNGYSLCAGTGNKSTKEERELTASSGFFVTPEFTTICGDESAVYTSNGSSETQWFIDDENGNAYLEHTGSAFIYSPASSVIIYVVDPTDESGESRQSVVVNVSNPWNIIVSSIIGGEPILQPGDHTTLSVNAGGNALSFEWSTGSHVQNPVVYPTSTTTYTVTVTDGNGCSDTGSVVVVVEDDLGAVDPGAKYFKSTNITGVATQYNQGASISGILNVAWSGYQSNGLLCGVKAYLSYEIADGAHIPTVLADVQPSTQVMVDLQGGSGSTGLSFSGVIPNVASGNYYLVVRCNPNLVSSDPIRTDNYVSIPIQVGLVAPSGHNFVVQCDNIAPAAGSTSDIVPGSKLNLNAYIYNWGAISDGVTVGVYLSENSTWDQGSDYLLNTNTWGHINAGSGLLHIFTNLLLSPDMVTHTGTWYLICVADPFGQYSETIETDNICALPFSVNSVNPASPNLTLQYPIRIRQGAVVRDWYPGDPAVQLLSFNPSQGNDDDYIVVTYNYCNIGNTAITEYFPDWQNRVFITADQDPVFDGDYPEYTEYSISIDPATSGGIFWPSSCREINADRKLAFSGLASGYIAVVLNDNHLLESDFGDNNAYVPITIEPSPLANKFDLSVRIDSLVPSQIEMGDSLVAYCVIKNNGPDSILAPPLPWRYITDVESRGLPISTAVQVVNEYRVDSSGSYIAPGDSMSIGFGYRVVNAPLGLVYYHADLDPPHEVNDINQTNNHASAPFVITGSGCFGYLEPFTGAYVPQPNDTIPWNGGNIGPFSIKGTFGCNYRLLFKGVYDYFGTNYGSTNSATYVIGFNTYTTPSVFHNRDHAVRQIEMWGGDPGNEKLLYTFYQHARPCGNDPTLFYYGTQYVNDFTPSLKLYFDQYSQRPELESVYWYLDTLGSDPIAVGDTLFVAPDTTTQYWFRFHSEQCGFGKWRVFTIISNKYHFGPEWQQDDDVITIACDASFVPNLSDVKWISASGLAPDVPAMYLKTIPISNDVAVVDYSAFIIGLTADTLHTYRTVIRIDTTPPVWSQFVPDSLSILQNDSLPTYQLLAVDNCSSVSIEYYDVRDTLPGVGIKRIVRVWTALDENGNGISQTQTVLVHFMEVTHLIEQPECHGDAGSVLITPQWAQPPVTYIWSDGGDEPFRPILPGDYTVTVVDSRGASVIDTISIIEPMPLSIGGAQNTLGCDLWIVGVFPSGGTPPYDVLWSMGDTTNAVFVTPGFISVTLTDSHGCISRIDSLHFEQMDRPIIESIVVIPDSCNAGGSIILLIDDPHTTVWSSGALGDILAVPVGSYTATISNEVGCDTIITVAVPAIECDTITSSISGVTTAKSLQILPNPTSGFCTVRVVEQSISRLEVFDQSGQILIVCRPSNLNTHTLNLTDIPAGVYVVMATLADGARAAARIIKK